jgi:hypothetical protein
VSVVRIGLASDFRGEDVEGDRGGRAVTGEIPPVPWTELLHVLRSSSTDNDRTDPDPTGGVAGQSCDGAGVW